MSRMSHAYPEDWEEREARLWEMADHYADEKKDREAEAHFAALPESFGPCKPAEKKA